MVMLIAVVYLLAVPFALIFELPCSNLDRQFLMAKTVKPPVVKPTNLYRKLSSSDNSLVIPHPEADLRAGSSS